MTTNSICVICATSFPYRKGKKYCSNSCKQQGYNNNKTASIAGIPGSDDHTTNKIFYLEEYRRFQNKRGWEIDLVTYCFLTKNFTDSVDVEFINEAVVAILNDDLIDNLKKEGHPIGRQFLQFQNEFHLGNYRVKNNRQADLN